MERQPLTCLLGDVTSMKIIPRWAHRLYAGLRGYSWQRCPSCDRFFGGHEIRAIREHRNSRPVDDMGLQYICPWCTAAGVGCVAWAIEGQPHVGCPFAPIDLTTSQLPAGRSAHRPSPTLPAASELPSARPQSPDAG
jgi:hypothetical protein